MPRPGRRPLLWKEIWAEPGLTFNWFGKAILLQAEDFSRHNPIHRWWGGTELTNDRLWRWDPERRTLIAP